MPEYLNKHSSNMYYTLVFVLYIIISYRRYLINIAKIVILLRRFKDNNFGVIHHIIKVVNTFAKREAAFH